MIVLKCGGVDAAAAWRRSPVRRRRRSTTTASPIFCAPAAASPSPHSISSEHLRSQLDQLHSEAHRTASKANSARLRLMRLSEAAEKLRRQAAISVQNGRENDARELLYQKKKVMEALEKSKARIELLDELSFKLNEAISAKESHLIDNVASDLDIVTDDASSTVRIVSPKNEGTNLNINEILVQRNPELTGDQGLPAQENQPDQPVCTSVQNKYDLMGNLAGSVQNECEVSSRLGGISSYEEFIKNIDQQLYKIEVELVTVLRVSTLVLDGDGKLKNLRVKLTADLLEWIHQIRERISSIIQAEIA